MCADCAFIVVQPVAGTVLDDIADVVQSEDFQHTIYVGAFMSVEVKTYPFCVFVCAGCSGAWLVIEWAGDGAFEQAVTLIGVEDDELVHLFNGAAVFIETGEVLDQRVCIFCAVFVNTFSQGEVGP